MSKSAASITLDRCTFLRKDGELGLMMRQNTRITKALIASLAPSLNSNMNSNILQAYLTCFYRHLQNCNDPAVAAALFWLAVFTSQAHPLLSSVSLKVMHAAVTCVTPQKSPPEEGVHAFLMQSRSSNTAVDQAVKELETSVEVAFTETNFAFAMAAVLAKTLHEDHLRADAVGKQRPGCFIRHADRIAALLRLLCATCMPTSAARINGHQQDAATMARLGYLIPLLAIAVSPDSDVSVDEICELASIPRPGSEDKHVSLLADLEVTDNVC